MQPVTTQRLIIRRLAEADLADFLAYQTHPEVLRYMPLEPMSEERATQFIAKQATAEIGGQGGYQAFALYHTGDARVIGEVGIYFHPEPESKGDIGWSLHPDYQGHGYATEAARVLLEYGFAQRSLRRITSVCDTRNPASFRLMERLGMRREGHLLQSHLTRGVWHDEYLYALLRDDWLVQQSTRR